MRSPCRTGLLGLVVSFILLAAGTIAARAADNPDDPPPLRIVAPASDKDKDDAPGALTPAFQPPVAVPGSDSDQPPVVKKKGKKAAAADPNSSDYQSEDSRHSNSGKREALIGTIEKDFDAMKSLGKKDNDADYFVYGTIDIQDHKAAVEYPIEQGMRKAAEAVADFMLDKPARAVRQWKSFGRAKNMKAAEFIKKKARDQSIEGQLEAFKLTKAGKKTLEDYFVVGTAELFPITENADVRFQVTGGTKDTASFLLDFILAGKKETKRQWHVFFRAKTQAEADKYIAQLRSWYDSQEQQRAQIAAIYHARTTRRC